MPITAEQHAALEKLHGVRIGLPVYLPEIPATTYVPTPRRAHIDAAAQRNEIAAALAASNRLAERIQPQYGISISATAPAADPGHSGWRGDRQQTPWTFDDVCHHGTPPDSPEALDVIMNYLGINDVSERLALKLEGQARGYYALSIRRHEGEVNPQTLEPVYRTPRLPVHDVFSQYTNRTILEWIEACLQETNRLANIVTPSYGSMVEHRRPAELHTPPAPVRRTLSASGRSGIPVGDMSGMAEDGSGPA